MSDKIYIFEFCSCIYESGYSLVSTHQTKAGAYRAMNKFINELFDQERNRHLLQGYVGYSKAFWNPLRRVAYKVREVEILK